MCWASLTVSYFCNTGITYSLHVDVYFETGRFCESNLLNLRVTD